MKTSVLRKYLEICPTGGARLSAASIRRTYKRRRLKKAREEKIRHIIKKEGMKEEAIRWKEQRA